MLNLDKKEIIFLFTPGPIGGAEKIVLHGINALRVANVNVSLWVIKEERMPQVTDSFIKLLKGYDIPLKIFSSHKIYDRKLMSSLRKAFSIFKPDIIHTHGFKAAFYGKVSAPIDSKLIVTHHGRTGHTLKVRFYEFIENQIMKRSSVVIAVSHDMKKMLVKTGVKASSIIVVENFLTSPVIKMTLIDSPSLKLLFAGRLSPEKGCSILIEAIKILRHSNLILTILGEGVEKGNLQERVKELNLEDKIVFAGFKDNVNEYMSSSDAIVIPSYREGQPLTLIEACCMGLPVIASNVGGIPELVNENKNGLLVPPDDPVRLSEALTKLFLNKAALQNSAKSLAPEYVERFCSQSWAKKTKEVYAMVLSHS